MRGTPGRPGVPVGFFAPDHRHSPRSWPTYLTAVENRGLDGTAGGPGRAAPAVLVPRSNASREAPSGAVEGGATRDVLVARLRESEGRFELLAESAPVLIWMTDLVQGCTYVNQRYVDFTGRRRDEEHGRRWVDVVHPDDVERVRKTFEHAVAERREFEAEYRLRRADGVYRWILASGMPRLGPDGTPIGYVGSAIDISERKQAERAGLLLLERERAARAAAQADSQAK